MQFLKMDSTNSLEILMEWKKNVILTIEEGQDSLSLSCGPQSQDLEPRVFVRPCLRISNNAL